MLKDGLTKWFDEWGLLLVAIILLVAVIIMAWHCQTCGCCISPINNGYNMTG